MIAHTSAVRSLSFHDETLLSGSNQNLIIIGSSDKIAKVYASNGINYELIKTMDFYSNYIYAVCHREGGGYAIASGS